MGETRKRTGPGARLCMLAAALGTALTFPTPGDAFAQNHDTSIDRDGALSALSALDRDVVAADASFSDAERAAARDRITGLRAEAGGLTEAAFELAVAGVAALSGNGHSQLYPARWKNDFPQLGVRFVIADDGLFIGDAVPEHEALVGQRVEHLEGHTLGELREAWARYATGREGYRDQSLPIFLEAPGMLRAAGVSERGDAVSLELADGRRVDVGLSGGWPPARGIWAFLPQSRDLALVGAGRIDEPALYLREPVAFFRFVPLPERDAVYLQFRANVDFSREVDLRQAAAEAIDRLRKIAPRYVIVDQRHNFGGDLNTTRDLMQAIPGIVPAGGAVFAITSGRTFSAGIASLGYLKQAAVAAGRDFTIIGSPIGDDLEFWAEGDHVRLPTGSLIGVATERHNYVTGCPEEDCHGSIRQHPIRVDTLDPDVTPHLTYDDLVNGRDPYLQAAFERMERP